jgi:hypothetical protein
VIILVARLHMIADRAREIMPTTAVLIVDTDLGFVFWLGQALDNAGYQALPAKSIGDATALLGELNLEIDLLIVSPFLEGARAFADTLRRSQGHLKLIALIDEWEERSFAFPEADASEYRPLNNDEVSRIQWLQTIEGVFEPPPGSTKSATAR